MITVRVLRGKVSCGLGLATRNFDSVMGLIRAHTGLGSLVSGTVNLRVDDPYRLCPDFNLEPSEYNFKEPLVFQRCRVLRMRCVLVRPYEGDPRTYHNPLDVLEVMSERHFRTALGITDGSELEVEVEGDDQWWAGDPV